MLTDLDVVAVIPARWESSRFPGKPLEKIRGRAMIEWVVEGALRARRVRDVVVATDDKRIFDAVLSFGGKAVMTSKNHVSGTDRIAEAIHGYNCSVVVNIQGDEPLISSENIDLVIEPFIKNSGLQVSTLKYRLKNSRDIFNPNVTKVVTDTKGFALYFSRAPIPFDRDCWGKIFVKNSLEDINIEAVEIYKHIGIYGYSRLFLQKFPDLPRSRLEEYERLEQLRILDQGVSIKVIETRFDSIGVDSPEDMIKVEQLINDNKF
tara:strand:+ start:526 stop:1314 length:789 start_codon:yes stop_codon:yes gene_type:complete